MLTRTAPRLDREPAARRGTDSQRPADHGHPLVHPDEAVPVARAAARSRPVVAHRHAHRPLAIGHLDRDRGAARVAARVGQRFLHDPIGGQLDARWERHRVAVNGQADAHAAAAGALDELRHPVEAGLGRAVGFAVDVSAQDAEQASHLGQRVAGGVADRGEALAPLGRHVRRRQARRLGLHGDHRDVVGDDVVQLAGDPRAFLRGRLLAQGVGHRPTRGVALGDRLPALPTCVAEHLGGDDEREHEDGWEASVLRLDGDRREEEREDQERRRQPPPARGEEIEVQGLTKRYGETLAVDGLSFTVPAGRVTGFVGPNGAGKSTTMRLILGLDAPDGGDALVNGRRYATLCAPLREVGALLDATALHPGRRAHDHLLWLAQSNGLPRDRVDEVLALVGLTAVARRRAGAFSLGMAQRLGIAAALLGDPPTLIFDEPVNGLDPEGVRWIRGFLRGLAAEGRAVLVSSHLMTELQGTADHLVVIGRGRLIADTSVTELLRAASGDAVTVRTPDPGAAMALLASAGATVTSSGRDTLEVTGMAADRVADLMAERGLRLRELTPHRASLEDAYMELTRDAVQFAAATNEEPGR
jgi:ABC-2 type transport system ATP-binding protein